MQINNWVLLIYTLQLPRHVVILAMYIFIQSEYRKNTGINDTLRNKVRQPFSARLEAILAVVGILLIIPDYYCFRRCF